MKPLKPTRRSIVGTMAVVGGVGGVQCIEAATRPRPIEATPIEATPPHTATPTETAHAIRRVIASQLRTRLTQLHRYCAHAECWDLALQNIQSGADHITFAPCCHDYKHNRTYYRVVAEWLQLGEYGVEAVRVQLGRGRRK